MERPVASDSRFDVLPHAREVIAAVAGCGADIGEHGLNLGHGQGIVEALYPNVGEEGLELLGPRLESEGLDVAPLVLPRNESGKLGEVSASIRGGVEGAPGDQHAPELGERPRPIWNVVEHVVGDRHVEGGSWKWQLLCVGDDVGYALREAVACCLDHPR